MEASTNNIPRVDTPKKRGRGRPKAIPSLVCPVCKKKFHRAPSQRRTAMVFCSHSCAGKFHEATTLNSPEQRRKRSERMKGDGNPNWSGGESKDSQGNKLILQPSHQRAWKSGYVPEKYLLFEDMTKMRISYGDRLKIVKDDYNNPIKLVLYRGHLMNGLDKATIQREFTFNEQQMRWTPTTRW